MSEQHEIKSQPVFYGNTIFRSRLEARWAVFFEACNIKWEYEPALFRLKNGKHYLPDFLLHDFTGRISGNLYTEIKGITDDYGRLMEEDSLKIWGFINPDEEVIPERPLLVLGDIFSRVKVKEAKSYGSAAYFDMACFYGTEEREFFQFMTLDGDNWPAIPGINKNGQPEIFGMDGDSSYYEFCDVEKTEAAYRTASNMRFV